jgi:hypothetical protein
MRIVTQTIETIPDLTNDMRFRVARCGAVELWIDQSAPDGMLTINEHPVIDWSKGRTEGIGQLRDLLALLTDADVQSMIRALKGE